jgi:pimeloyl-ACP methyl ester carboxylesterase
MLTPIPPHSRRELLASTIAATALGLVLSTGATHAEPTAAAAERPVLPGLAHGDVVANGVRLHYVVAGQGEPVLLLHGWPESLIAWSQVMPQLVKAGRRVWAIDYRGAGESDKPAAGYELDNVARDVHAFIEAKHLADGGRGVDVIGHDIGSWIGHALATNHPADVRRLVLSEALLPALAPPAAGVPDEAANLRTWQFSFNRLEDLPETLVQGHERAYLAFLFDTKSVRRWKIDSARLDEYVREYSAPGTLRAGFAYYRTNYAEAGLAQARARAAKRLEMPVLTIGGSGGIRDLLLKTLQPLAADVQGAVLDDCGHFLPEECPDEFVRAVTGFWASRR